MGWEGLLAAQIRLPERPRRRSTSRHYFVTRSPHGRRERPAVPEQERVAPTTRPTRTARSFAKKPLLQDQKKRSGLFLFPSNAKQARSA
jgi:hypothetical protein